MPIMFCATTAALNQVPAQLPPETSVTTLVIDGESSHLEAVPNGATVRLEAAPAHPQSYQPFPGEAVSKLAKRGVRVIVGPSWLKSALVTLFDAGGPGERATLHVGAIALADAAALLLTQEHVCVLLLQTDVVVVYEPESGYVSAAGAGCAVMLATTMAAGNPPAAIVVDVLVPGMRLCWSTGPHRRP